MFRKKIKSMNYFISLFLLLFDQTTKILVFYTAPYNVNVSENSILSIHAVFNNYGNFANAKWQLGYFPYFFILINIVLIFLILFAYDFLKSRLCLGHNSKSYDFLWCLMLAGTLASFFDKVFWNYTLDFISIKNLAVFDLKDLYYIIGITGLIALIFRSDSKKLVNKCNISTKGLP